jgi:Ca2+:H+ antiporter
MEEQHILIFALAYVAMIPCANLIGFAGQELSRKLPRVIGMLTEITCVLYTSNMRCNHN